MTQEIIMKSETNETFEIGRGNTKISPIQRIFWFFTLNNYEEHMIETLETYFNLNCKAYIFQEEIGAEGTPHLQGSIQLINRMRLSELKVISPKIHWEMTKSWLHSANYCLKEESRKINGRICCKNVKSPEIIRGIQACQLYDWQKVLIEKLKTDADDRSINWIWSEAGRTGKSSFIKYLLINKFNVCLVGSTTANMVNAVYNHKNKTNLIVAVDLSRDSSPLSYEGLEQIKNGFIFNSKYETGSCIFNSPHILVFSNQQPNYHKWSEDRFDVINID